MTQDRLREILLPLCCDECMGEDLDEAVTAIKAEVLRLVGEDEISACKDKRCVCGSCGYVEGRNQLRAEIRKRLQEEQTKEEGV